MMNVKKIQLDQIQRCYSASYVHVDKELKVLLASEAVGGSCYSYSGKDFENKEVVWESAGGTMSIVEIPGTNGEFLATQNFFPGFDAKTSKIVHGRYVDGKWLVEDFMVLPYVHRFDILKGEDGLYFIGATLCTSKTEREDWSDPGKVYVGKLTGDYTRPVALSIVKEGLTRNHGYCRGEWRGRQSGFVTTDEGVFVVTPPGAGKAAWQVEQLMERRVSDVALCDIDNCGVDELVTIEPFHGADFKINKKVGDSWQVAYEYPEEIEFAHVVWGGKIRGRNTVIGGIRRRNAELFMVDMEDGAFRTTLLETGKGPANIAVVHEENRDVIVCANNTVHEAALYIIED